MRAFIIRSDECKEFLESVECDEDCYFDQDHYLNHSGESFHGEVNDESFRFHDARLPSINIPLSFVEIEK